MKSIEFRPLGSFSSEHFSSDKSRRKVVREGGLVTASATLFVPQRQILFVGLTDGKILGWETDRHAERRSKDKAPMVLDEHKGGVHCMMFMEALCDGVLFTGAADRCIKMWDLADPRGGVACVHTVHGHGGTILALECAGEVLLSSSTDGLLCVWQDQSPARLLRFPAYGIRQKISPLPKTAGQAPSRVPKDRWFTCISIREGEVPCIFAGDSAGYVHVFQQEESESEQDRVFQLTSKPVKVHELGISRIMCVANESFFFTLSHDHRFKTIDCLSFQVVFETSNQCGEMFTCLSWDSACQEAICADNGGNIGFFNLYTESCVSWRSLSSDPIVHMSYDPSTRRLLLLSPTLLRVFEVVRGVKLTEFNEHTGPVVAMHSRPSQHGGFLYTAAMDNTIRMWDTDSMECIKTLKEPRHEITAMVYLPRTNVVVTGNEDSDLKMWSFDGGSDAVLKHVSGHNAHSNTISCLAFAAGTSQAGDEADLGLGETLIVGSYDRKLSLWKVTLSNDSTAQAKMDQCFLAHQSVGDEILCVAFCQAAGAIFTGGNEGIIQKRLLNNPRVLAAEYEGHEDAINCFAVDANFLYSGSVDCTVRIWETSHDYELKCVRAHQVTVQALLVAPETGFVASCGSDGKVVFWDPWIGQDGVNQLQSYEQPEEFRCLAYNDLTRSVLAGCESGRILAFPAPSGVGGFQPPARVPKVLQGMETPRSDQGGDTASSLEVVERMLQKGTQ